LSSSGLSSSVAGPDSAALDLVLTEWRRYLEATAALLRDLDGKALEIVKLDGVILGLAAAAGGLLARSAPGPRLGAMARLGAAVGVAGLALLAGSILAAVLVVGRRNAALGIGAPPGQLAEGLSRDDACRYAIETYASATETNRALADRKGKAVDWALVLLALGVLLLGVGGLVLILEVME